ncbi:MAG: hypothetical protein J6U05_07045, partial [Neisseriaceae bacterium]|nr:hypothetical protein [Neisseriaceae bacterium]
LNLKNSENIALIRLGKLCGAESKTIHEISNINITPPKRNKEFACFAKENTTICLTEDKLPLGWALLEVNPSAENAALKTWCEENNHIVKTINQNIKLAEEHDKQLK